MRALSDWVRRHIVADDPEPALSVLDSLDGLTGRVIVHTSAGLSLQTRNL